MNFSACASQSLRACLTYLKYDKLWGLPHRVFTLLKVLFHRERYINCTCSLDLIEKVSQESLFRVLRERLSLVDALDKIIIFNYELFGSCADIVLSYDDFKQWKVI